MLGVRKVSPTEEESGAQLCARKAMARIARQLIVGHQGALWVRQICSKQNKENCSRMQEAAVRLTHVQGKTGGGGCRIH